MNTLDDAKLAEERRKLTLISCKVLIDYIRSSIEILLNLKAEDQTNAEQQLKKDKNLAKGFGPFDYNSQSLNNISLNSSRSNVILQLSKCLLQKQTTSL